LSVTDLLLRSATALATLVHSGEVGARELVETSLRRIEQLDPAINAFTHVAAESALAAADAIGPGDPRPFAGVPIAVKDNRPVVGMPLTMCSDLFGDYVARHDAFLVRRLRDAGFVIVGKTTLPEMGALPTTESRRFGPTRNPWDLDRTPGGSSGGSGAAVAAGMVPIAHGNDGGGSLRVPAACCGLVGLKPSRGRVSVGPDGGQSFLGADGVLTRTVADTAATLDVLSGPEPGDAAWAPPPPGDYAELAQRDPGRLRVGLVMTPPIASANVDPVCAQAARDAAALLESLGHEVEELEPPWSGLDLGGDFALMFGGGVAFVTWIGSRVSRQQVTDAIVEPLTWGLWELARDHDTIALMRTQSRLESVARSLITAMAPYDAVLTPALAARPLGIGEVHGRGPDPWDHFSRSGQFTPFTSVINVTGLPAIALPLYHGDDGLPTAVHLIGRPVEEHVLLSLATQLESALPWDARRPELVAA
jgi:amidase